MAEQANVATLIARRHPKFATYESDWIFFLESYLGGSQYIVKHLFKYIKEGDDEFTARRNRAYRENHTKRVIDLVSSYLFKEEAERQTENSKVKAFWEDFDGRKKSVSNFMKRASLFASILGRVYIVCDKAPLPEALVTGTQADNLKTEAKPYSYMVYPQDVLDIAFDEVGKIKWILIRERKRDDDDPYLAAADYEDRYRLWTSTTWELFDKDGLVLEEGEHKLGRVPVVILDNEEQDDLAGQSLVADIAYLDRAIFNNWSRLDVIVNDQTFSQLIFPIEGLPVEAAEDKELRDKFLALAQNRVMLYSAAAGSIPGFISPDATQADFILRMIQAQVKQLYASLGLQAETGTEANVQSGVAKAYDFDKLNKLLATKADNCEQAENEILDIFKQWLGGIQADASVEYPDEFDTRSLMDEIAMAQELTLLDISETFTKELHKSIVAKTMPKLDKKALDKINKEIDDRDLEKEQAAVEPVFPFDKQGGKAQAKQAGPAKKGED